MIYYYLNREEWPSSLNEMYDVCGITKQGFCQYFNRHKRHAEEQVYLIDIIRQIRKDHPTMCCRYMYFKINPSSMGRDRFEALCRAHGFTIHKRRSKRRTTDSNGVVRFDNLVEGLDLDSVDQVWSSDITYFEIDNSFYYLTFILDCYSRKILGYSVSNRLLTEQTTLPALRMALKNRNWEIPSGVIFHSDGGGQYYEKKFLELTNKYAMKNSMCEYAYQNGKAERINGVIKNNYLKHWNIQSLNKLTNAVDRAVGLYNEDKPHISLDRMTPNEYEKSLHKLATRNKSKMKESFDAKNQINRASSPDLSEQNKSQNHDVISAKMVE